MSIKCIVFCDRNLTSCLESDIVLEELRITHYGMIVHKQDIGRKHHMIHWYHYQIPQGQAEAFLKKLDSRYKLQEWKGNISGEGISSWSWEIQYDIDHHLYRRINGIGEIPAIGLELRQDVLNLADYMPKPHILGFRTT